MRHVYRRPVIGDTPLNGPLFKLRYGTPRKFRNYLRMLRSYRRQELEANNRPCELHIEPTNVCNLTCPLCPTGVGELGRERGRMTVETFARVLDGFADDLFCLRMWTWGEPLLNRDLWIMVRMAEDRRVGTEVSTNLSIKLSDRRIEELVGSGLTWLTVSADGASPDTYATYRRGGDYDLVVSNLRRIVEARRAMGSITPFVEWQFVPLQHNEHEIADAKRGYRRLGVDGFRLKPARLDKTRQLSFSGEAIPPDILAWKPTAPEHVHEAPGDDDAYLPYHCPILWRSATVHHDGRVALCCETFHRRDDVGHLDEDFKALWNGDSYRNARRIALGRNLGAEDAAVPCYGCRVFKKPVAKSSGMGTN